MAAEPSTQGMAGVMEDEATITLWCIFYSASLELIGDLKYKRLVETLAHILNLWNQPSLLF